MTDTLSKYFNTLVYLRPKQIFCQLWNRMYRAPYLELTSPEVLSGLKFSRFITKPVSYDGHSFSFLNIGDAFTSWDDLKHGMLWTYNLNYMDFLQQDGLTFEEGMSWIERFIADVNVNKVGQDPYPTALRALNWIKFINEHFSEIDAERLGVLNDSLYSQCVYLSKRIQYHLMGNHLLEDAFSLSVASIYFSDRKLYKKSSRLLRRQLREQILPDGAHFEQSPMYHCILLDRLLDCYNFSINNIRHEGQDQFNAFLKDMAMKMLGHLEAILYSDRSFPLFNDSAIGISPQPEQLLSYARRLGLAWEKIPMKDVGYRYMSNEHMEMFADVGNVTASYQPGHTHADTFTYELRMDGLEFIVDTGISTYEKDARRLYERGTKAHNTVVVGGRDSSQVWSGFRLGRRAGVTLLEDAEDRLTASHDGYGKDCRHTRTFSMSSDMVQISDSVSNDCSAAGYVHLAPGVKVLSCSNEGVLTDRGMIEICGAESVKVEEGNASESYNSLKASLVLVVRFVGSMSYTIKKN